MFVFVLIIKLNIPKSQKCFFIAPKNFNSSLFINVDRETPFLGKNKIQTLRFHFFLVDRSFNSFFCILMLISLMCVQMYCTINVFGSKMTQGVIINVIEL